MSEYIEFVETGDTGKTKIFKVRSLSSHKWLGFIRWHAPWRQYTFFPAHATVWNNDCLKAIITFVFGLMEERKAEHECSTGVHIYRVVTWPNVVAGDKSAMKCERCGKPYTELDVL